MIGPVGKVLLVLANSDLRGGDLRNFARWLSRSDAQRLVDAVERTRAFADSFGSPKIQAGELPALSARTDVSTDLADKVIQLLGEATVSRNEAMKLLALELSRETGVDIQPGDPRKTPLRKWIELLAAVVPESLLLHVATRIRNTRVHDKKSDWPLRGSE